MEAVDECGVGAESAVWSRLPLAEAVWRAWACVAAPERLAAIFEAHRGRCYEREIAFPDLVQLMMDALLEHGGSGHQSFTRGRERGVLTASTVSAYGKLGRLPLAVSQALVTGLGRVQRELFPDAARRQSVPCLRGFRTVTLDGKAIKRVAKRLKPLRKVGGGLLGGRALVAQEWETGLIVALHADEDGDANDVRFVPHLLPVLREELAGGLLFLADSGFCDLSRLAEFTAAGNHVLIRSHPKVGFHPDTAAPMQTGVDAAGRSFSDQVGWLGAASHPQRRFVRRITLERPGEPAVILITDLLDARQFPAAELLEHYRERWGIEQVFQQVTEVFQLQSLIGSTPKATVFQFAFCLLLYNLIQLVRGFVAAHRQRAVETLSVENLFGDVRRELTAWSVLTAAGVSPPTRPATDPGAVKTHLHTLLANAWSRRWIKAVNQQRRARQPHPHNRTHGSVFRLIHPDKHQPRP